MKPFTAEVLAPAGSYESMKAAVSAGADAVYMGGSRFGARAFADNPGEEQLLEAIDYVHLHGRKLYLTVNTLMKEEELGELYRYLEPYYLHGLDAVIVQDMGVFSFIKRNFPGLPIHASTQMTITGTYGARLLESMGAQRIVTARELSLEEIARIHRETQVELECFVHGAMCYCYSGQCLLSSLIGGRSGNRGRCAQPCRLPYEVRQGNRTLNKKDERYVLSLKDLCTLDIIPEILEAGVRSLKIEGRMKSPRYTAGVVSVYRKYVDLYGRRGREGYAVADDDRKLLSELFDRGGFEDGYYRRRNGRDMVVWKEKPAFRQGSQELFEYLDRTYVDSPAKAPVTGEVRLEPGKKAELSLRLRDVSATVQGSVPSEALNQPLTEEKLRRQLEKTGNTPFVIRELAISAPDNLFMPIQELNELRRNGLEALRQEILKPFRRPSPPDGREQNSREPDCRGRDCRGQDGREPGERERNGWEQNGRERGERERNGWERDGWEQNGRERGERERNGWKRNGREQSERERSGESAARTEPLPRLSISIERPDTLAPMLECPDISRIYLDCCAFPPSSWKTAALACHRAGKECMLAMPHIFRERAERFFETHRERLAEAEFDGVLARSLEEAGYLEKAHPGLPMIFDCGIYVMNREAAGVMRGLGAAGLTYPMELNSRELAGLGGGEELIVYGRAAVMVTAQCIRQGLTGCLEESPPLKKTEGGRAQSGLLTLKDRMGKEFPVRNCCRFCYNILYNSAPLSLLGQESAVKAINPQSLRLQFTTEEPEEAIRQVRAFADSYLRGRRTEQALKEFTRGHFKRGVE